MEKADKDIADIVETQKRIAELTERIKATLRDIKSFKVFGENQQRLENQLNALQTRVSKATTDSKSLIADTEKKYANNHQPVPTDLAQELSALELLTETLSNTMDEKDRDFKRARTIRYDYAADVDEVTAWLQKAELKVQDRTLEPSVLKEQLQQLQSEIGPICEKLERLTKNGRTIIDNAQDEAEKEVIRSTIDNLTEQMSQVKSLLEDKKQKVGDCLDAWARFLALNETVRQWVEVQREFLARSLHLTTLQQTRQKLNEYSVSSRYRRSYLDCAIDCSITNAPRQASRIRGASAIMIARRPSGNYCINNVYRFYSRPF